MVCTKQRCNAGSKFAGRWRIGPDARGLTIDLVGRTLQKAGCRTGSGADGPENEESDRVNSFPAPRNWITQKHHVARVKRRKKQSLGYACNKE